MTDRRPFIIVTVIAVASLTVGAVLLMQANRIRDPAVPRSDSDGRSTGDVIISSTDVSKLPAGTQLLPATERSQIRGIVLCGRCIWGIGDTCNVMIWDKEGQHVLTVLLNEQLTELGKLRGSG